MQLDACPQAERDSRRPWLHPWPPDTQSDDDTWGRPFSRTAEDQQLLLDEHGFGHHRAGTTGTSESGTCHMAPTETVTKLDSIHRAAWYTTALLNPASPKSDRLPTLSRHSQRSGKSRIPRCFQGIVTMRPRVISVT